MIQKIWKTVSVCLLFLFFTSFSWGQTNNPLVTMEIPSSPNPVGSGARALGMAGAFIAVADDATAASWNPGGLIQLERPEISVVFDAVYRTEKSGFEYHPEAAASESIDTSYLNYLSIAYPFKIKQNMILSLNYQRMYDFNREWNFRFEYDDSSFVEPVQYDNSS